MSASFVRGRTIADEDWLVVTDAIKRHGVRVIELAEEIAFASTTARGKSRV